MSVMQSRTVQSVSGALPSLPRPSLCDVNRACNRYTIHNEGPEHPDLEPVSLNLYARLGLPPALPSNLVYSSSLLMTCTVG